MKKIRFLLLLIIPIAIYMGCTKGSQTIGPAGKPGAAGSQGAAPIDIGSSIQLDASAFTGIAPNQSTYYQFFSSPSASYMLSVYVASVYAPSVWYKLPVFNVCNNNDELFASLGYDTVRIYYYCSGTTWPIDSVFNCNIIINPQAQ